MLMKLAGAVSSCNAMLLLSKSNYHFQAAILARAIDEANLSIMFMLPDMSAGEWPTKRQSNALGEFFLETWNDPSRPFDCREQRSQIRLKDLAAALGRMQTYNDGWNPHDAGQVGVQMQRLLSDFTHMAYPALMDLYDQSGELTLEGQSSAGRLYNIDMASRSLWVTCNTAESVAALLQTMYRGAHDSVREIDNEKAGASLTEKAESIENIERSLQRLRHEIEKCVQVFPDNSGRLLRKYKGKSN